MRNERRNRGAGPPEILSKKYKERDLNNVKAVAATATKTSSAKHRPPQRPDTIDREISKPLQEPKSRGGDDDHSMTVTMITKEPGPYDIDIVYHYKLYRDNMRTYKTSQPPPMSNNYHHQNQQSQSRQRHDPTLDVYTPRSIGARSV
ncbi:hypothetical protein TKK_0009916 [Trichogramma kaykai]